MKKICLSILLITLAANIMAAVYNGSCGTNLNWSLNTSTRTLTITGSGDMDDYAIDEDGNLYSPWANYVGYVSNIHLPEGLTSIGDGAFALTNITNITLPSGLTRIGNSAFYDCQNLESVVIPDAVVDVEDCCFMYCSKLANVQIGSGIHKIPNRCFSLCVKLDNVEIGTAVDTIGVCAFYADSALHNISFAEGLSVIDSSAFKRCVELEHINLPQSVRVIEYCAFLYSGLRTLVCNEGLQEIHSQAFCSCSGLSSFHVSSTVRVIEQQSFLLCPNLMSLTVDANNAVYYSPSGSNSVLLRSSNALVVGCSGSSIPPLVTRIEQGIFTGTTIQYLTIPNQIKVLEKQSCWMMGSLQFVQIGSGVDTIGDYAFGKCYALDTIKCLAVDPPVLGTDVWYELDKSHIVLQVPFASISLYQAAEQWNEFDIQAILVKDTVVGGLAQLSWEPVDYASLYELCIYSTDSTIGLDTTLIINADEFNGGIMLQSSNPVSRRINKIVLDGGGTIIVVSIDPTSGTSASNPFTVTISTNSDAALEIKYDMKVYQGQTLLHAEVGAFWLNELAIIPTSLSSNVLTKSLPSGIYDLYGHRYPAAAWESLPTGVYVLRDGEKMMKVMKK